MDPMQTVTAGEAMQGGDAGQRLEGPAVGWLVITDGPGRGRSREIGYGMNSIGRDPSQRIPLDFGDAGIARQKAAAIAFVPNQRKFYLTPGESINIVYRNDEPVLAPTELKVGDVIKVGETSLRFVPLCGPEFSWEDAAK